MKPSWWINIMFQEEETVKYIIFKWSIFPIFQKKHSKETVNMALINLSSPCITMRASPWEGWHQCVTSNFTVEIPTARLSPYVGAVGVHSGLFHPRRKLPGDDEFHLGIEPLSGCCSLSIVYHSIIRLSHSLLFFSMDITYISGARALTILAKMSQLMEDVDLDLTWSDWLGSYSEWPSFSQSLHIWTHETPENTLHSLYSISRPTVLGSWCVFKHHQIPTKDQPLNSRKEQHK